MDRRIVLFFFFTVFAASMDAGYSQWSVEVLQQKKSNINIDCNIKKLFKMSDTTIVAL